MADSWAPYDRMGDEFVERAERGPYNAQYDRPAVLAALGPVGGLDLLDAGCGPGVYAEHLVRAGARVTGFDASEVMVDRARTRLGTAVRIDRLRLDEALPYPDESFDRVVCALAIHYSDDRDATFREFHRVLRTNGRAVVSTQHPSADWLRKGGSYFAVQHESDGWRTSRGEVQVGYWREPLKVLCGSALAAGFLIDLVDEPMPSESMRRTHPEDFEKLSTEPGFLVLGLLKV